jgi:two-component system cell cycle sensor histidine kinase/response regulator CckA
VTSRRERPQTKSEIPHGNETLLLLEDDETVRRLTRMILEDLGYRVLSAEDGAQAARLSKSFQGEIHLLLSDIVLPEGDGVQWAHRLRRERPALATLFMSGYAAEALRRQGVVVPETRFLKKPVPPKLLASKIREVLGT